ncbi:MAG: hypothetical protein PHU46_10740 [Rhodocyclaceae bacterium]|nr:hypothetical protein [Rhodocyclaceae bacterium]
MDIGTQRTANTPAKRTSGGGTQKSHPYFPQKVVLQSLHAQRVFERGFEVCAGSFFILAIVLPTLATKEQALEAQGMADERFNSAFRELGAEAERLAQLAESHGIDMASVGMAYTAPQEFSAEITSPNAVRYVALIREFDKLVASFDVLFLSGVMPNADYSLQIYEWKRKLLRLAGDIRKISGRAMASARRKDVPIPSELAPAAVADSQPAEPQSPSTPVAVPEGEPPAVATPAPISPRKRRAGAPASIEADASAVAAPAVVT